MSSSGKRLGPRASSSSNQRGSIHKDQAEGWCLLSVPRVPLAIHCVELDAILAMTADVPLCPVDSEIRLNNSPTMGEMLGQWRKQRWECPHPRTRGRYKPELSRSTGESDLVRLLKGEGSLVSLFPCFNPCYLKLQLQGSYGVPLLKHHGYNHVHTVPSHPFPYPKHWQPLDTPMPKPPTS